MAVNNRVQVKVCGISTTETLHAAAEAGAAYVGFVFFPGSPRHLSWDDGAYLAAHTPPGVCKVALTVDPDDETAARLAALPVDMVQLHGRETPARVADLRARLGLPLMKAIGIAAQNDVKTLAAYEEVADQILCDHKPAAGPLPGGTGIGFDWRLISGRRWQKPWMLAGGLTAANVADAVAMTGARQVDVSSGVESARGVKDPALIESFIAATHQAASSAGTAI